VEGEEVGGAGRERKETVDQAQLWTGAAGMVRGHKKRERRGDARRRGGRRQHRKGKSQGNQHHQKREMEARVIARVVEAYPHLRERRRGSERRLKKRWQRK
jgi:hypothetical protein